MLKNGKIVKFLVTKEEEFEGICDVWNVEIVKRYTTYDRNYTYYEVFVPIGKNGKDFYDGLKVTENVVYLIQ